ncbi:hypothetical protein ACXU4B_11630 [Dyella soli]|uniref:Uncharacterized protein n=1 Tax=Dyella soli TaxID=522319 RepID=A0A4R0YNM9_9GAMM|nr:hypothetical protein [Dyella soli]TCI07187.1 hypothetical protein EZM97_31800 [Dyella soli]
MHFEVPKIRMHTFREFAQHYLMIVLSILTALGLEQWIESVHHRHAAENASMQIDAELRGTLDDIHKSMDANTQKLAPLRALNEAITADVRNGVPDQEINRHIQAMKDKFLLSINWPTFPSQAWDVAVANQSATWIATEKLHKYAGAYAIQREAANWMAYKSTLALDAPRMVELRTRIRLGKEVDPLELLGVLQQMINSSAETISHLEETARPVQAALQGEQKP